MDNLFRNSFAQILGNGKTEHDETAALSVRNDFSGHPACFPFA